MPLRGSDMAGYGFFYALKQLVSEGMGERVGFNNFFIIITQVSIRKNLAQIIIINPNIIGDLIFVYFHTGQCQIDPSFEIKRYGKRSDHTHHFIWPNLGSNSEIWFRTLTQRCNGPV